MKINSLTKSNKRLFSVPLQLSTRVHEGTENLLHLFSLTSSQLTETRTDYKKMKTDKEEVEEKKLKIEVHGYTNDTAT